MSDSFNNVIGGRLKLKRAAADQKKQRKSKKGKVLETPAADEAPDTETVETPPVLIIAPSKTQAELKFEKTRKNTVEYFFNQVTLSDGLDCRKNDLSLKKLKRLTDKRSSSSIIILKIYQSIMIFRKLDQDNIVTVQSIYIYFLKNNSTVNIVQDLCSYRACLQFQGR